MTETPTEHLKGPVLVYHGGMHGLGSMWQGLLTVQQIGCRKTPQVTSRPARPHFQKVPVSQNSATSLGSKRSEREAMGGIFSSNHNFLLMSVPSPDSDLSQLIKEGCISSGHRLISQQCDLAPLAVPACTDAPRPVINHSCPFPSPAIACPNPRPLNPRPSRRLSCSLRV